MRVSVAEPLGGDRFGADRLSVPRQAAGQSVAGGPRRAQKRRGNASPFIMLL